MDNVPATAELLSTPFITAVDGDNGCSSCCSRKVAACVSFLKFSKKEPSLLNVFLNETGTEGRVGIPTMYMYIRQQKRQTHLKGVPLGLTLALACSSTGCWLTNVVVVVVCCCCCLSNISRFFRKIISSCSHICTTRWFLRLVVGLGRDILAYC